MGNETDKTIEELKSYLKAVRSGDRTYIAATFTSTCKNFAPLSGKEIEEILKLKFPLSGKFNH